VKKFILCLAILSLFPLTAAYSQDAVTLDTAIAEVAGYLETRLPARTVVAVLNIKSDSKALSGHIISGLVNAFISGGTLVPVDREHIGLIQDELQFQETDDVSDKSAQAIGKLLGTETIVSGEVIAMNSKRYRLEIKAISVETAAIQGTIGKNVLNDKKMKELTGSGKTFPVSIGGGVHIGGSFTTGTREEKGKQNVGGLIYDSTITETNSASGLDIGGFVFFDLKYAEINVSMYNGSGNSKWSWSKEYAYNVLPSENDSASGGFSSLLLNIGLLAKYPFYLGNITLFPAIGVDYQLWLLHRENKKPVSGDLSANNAVWLKIGGGIDYHFTPALFLRGELLWAVKLPNKNERGDSFTWFTHSPSARIGLGYVFGR